MNGSAVRYSNRLIDDSNSPSYNSDKLCGTWKSKIGTVEAANCGFKTESMNFPIVVA